MTSSPITSWQIDGGTMDWIQIGKGRHESCILSPYLFNIHAEYIMWNVRLKEAQAGIKIAGININNLKYVDDITLVVLMKVKEVSEKVGLYSTFKKEDHDIQSHHFMANRWENKGNSNRLYFLGFQNHCRYGDCSHAIKRHLLLRRKAMTNTDSILKSRDITLPTNSV